MGQNPQAGCCSMAKLLPKCKDDRSKKLVVWVVHSRLHGEVVQGLQNVGHFTINASACRIAVIC